MLQEYLYMALGLGQVIATNIGRSFKKFVNNTGKQTLGIPDLSDSSKLNQRPSTGFTNLAFPLDVAAAKGNGNHGHYVMFFVNEQTNAKLKFGDDSSYNLEIPSEYDSLLYGENQNTNTPKKGAVEGGTAARRRGSS